MAPISFGIEQNMLITVQSPITFSHSPPRFPTDVDFGAAPSGLPEAGSKAEPQKEQKTNEPKYSPLFKLGLFFSVPLCFLLNAMFYS